MTEEPARVRRRVAQEEPGTPPSIKRLYWYGGAALGVLAGVLIALFVVPPIFDRYFGVADIELGHEYGGEGVRMGVTSAGAAADDPGRFNIVLAIAENDGWCPTASDFRLELVGRVSIGGAQLTPDPASCRGSGPLEAETLTVSFPAGVHSADELHILHIEDPKVRFWLQPAEPGE